MSQHDLSIANQGFPAFRSDLNSALQALGSLSSGTSAPSTTYANMLWYDSTNNIVKMRNEDNDAWIALLTLDQTADEITYIGALQLALAVTTTGTQTLTNKTITGTKETVYAITDGAGFEIDPANGGIQTVTLGASRSPAVTNFTAGQSVLLGIDDGSAYSITWPSITWANATNAAPTLSTSGYTWVVMWKAGSTLYGKY